MTSNLTNRAQFETLVAEHNTSFYDYGDDGILLLHPEDSRIHHLTGFSAAQINDAQAFLSSMDQKQQHAKAKPFSKNRLTLDIDSRILSHSEEASLLHQTILSEAEFANVVVRLHFADSNTSWADLLHATTDAFSEQMKTQNIRLVLSGTFEMISQEDCQFLSSNRIDLEFVHDLAADSFEFSEKTRSCITQISEIGFRVPFVWYVDDRNIDAILPLINEAMYLNFHSGFSVPAFQYHLTNPMPSAALAYGHYLRLLVDIYEQYTFCDDVLYPLNDLHLISLHSGRSNFIRREYYDRNLQKIIAYLRTELSERIEAFFLRVFLWQRWKITAQSALLPTAIQ